MTKHFKYYLMAMAAMLTFCLASCSNDDELLDIDDEEEYLPQIVDDIDVSVINYVFKGCVDAKDPESTYVEDCCGHGPVIYVTDDNLTLFKVLASIKGKLQYSPCYTLNIYTSKKLKDLKTGDVIEPEHLHFVNCVSSFICGDETFELKGDITVAETSESTMTLKFDNVIVKEVHSNTGLTHKEFLLNGTVPYQIK